ncbi:MAG TPA: hypothetical protein VIK65_09405 [Candidatus Limnocylindrales bacterium]
MPALEPVDGLRVVATVAALDSARWHGEDVDVLRIAPDEAFAIGATGAELDDPDAIVEPEVGFAVALLGRGDLATVAAHTDWSIPEAAGTLAQGKIAGVPAKVLVGDPTLLVTQVAYVDDLERRLGWR